MDAAWVQSLIAMFKPGGCVTLLEDLEQSLNERPTFSTTDWPLIESPVNSRSTRILVDFMNHLEPGNKPIEAGNGILAFDPV